MHVRFSLNKYKIHHSHCFQKTSVELASCGLSHIGNRSTLWILYLSIRRIVKVLHCYVAPSAGYALSKVLYMQLVTSQLRHIQLCHSFVMGSHLSNLNSLESIQVTMLPLVTVNLFGMHIFPPITINAGTHFTYPQGDGGLSQLLARLSQEWVLNLGPHAGRSAALPTELSQLTMVISDWAKMFWPYMVLDREGIGIVKY